MKLAHYAVVLGFLGLSVVVGGCGRAPAPPQAAQSKAVDTNHEHEKGRHGGNIIPLGLDNYHVEVISEKGGVLRLYLLGRDETRVQETEAQPLNAHVTVEGEETEAAQIVFRPEPQPDDAPGKTSQFVSHLPGDLVGKSLHVTVPSITIQKERFRFEASVGSRPGHDGDMPAKVSEADEKSLYLTPGGIYTKADIEANGKQTASQRFRGLKSSHNARPAAGDKVCPISETKANAKFTWIVNGRKYEFCCPPCVDEFVKTAKENPHLIKEPGEYTRK